MSIIGSNILAGASGQAGGGGAYEIQRSLRFNSSDSAYLSRTPASAGNRKTWTWAGWVKRSGLLGTRQGIFVSSEPGFPSNFTFEFETDRILVVDSNITSRMTTAVFRDTSAWMHLLIVYDTTQATANNRIKIYANGSEITAFDTIANPALNADGQINKVFAHSIGSHQPAGGLYLDGYLAEVHFIDGQALTPSSFTEVSATTGQLIPKAFSGSYGTNGFHLKFADNSNNTATTLGADTSGNGNNWTPNNLSVTAGAGNDSLVDTPTSYGTDTGAGGEVRGNYCTWNPLANGGLTLANGNLDASRAAASWVATLATIGISSGKRYWEHTCTATQDSANITAIGIGTSNVVISTMPGFTGGNGWVYVSESGYKWFNGSGVAYGATWTNGDVIGIAFDADNGTLVFYKNNVSQGTAYTGLTSGPYFPVLSMYGTSSGPTNFGQRPFAYTAPSGFKALCDTNLPAPVVAKPSTVMDVKLYTGNGSTQTISGLGFSPDFVWIKSRSNGYGHNVRDIIRGGNARLITNETDAEYTSGEGVISFTSSGFDVTTSSIALNDNGATFVAWAWDAGSSTVTNTQGSISSQVRANASAGFSIVTYTAPSSGSFTVGHGLGVAPQFIITKSRTDTYVWATYHVAIGNTGRVDLNSTNAVTTTQNSAWNNTSPTSTVFTLGTNWAGSGITYVAYCFAPVAGYSSFGSYTGNGSADGPFVYTGFRPRWVMIKRVDNPSGAWTIVDTSRDTYNVSKNRLRANDSAAEDGIWFKADLVSNGFKLRDNDQEWNLSERYIYAAFAESPFQYARAR